ncbi:MAG: acetylornithine transaminase [SAR86 cluster bacterium]|uniref:Acetylornithine aminotransferase n=1 Tax=SAR86 cluster bacterium TaxID=2030880 RepID=A0A2A5B416_9GAMM|nr:MAG: acetylornithine transaminase [SAR86 cluster bacterium]
MTSALMQNYGKPELEFDHGKGSFLYAVNGDRYLDFAMGIAVNSLGHCHPALVDAITKQANTLWHTSNLYRIAGSEELAARLVEHSFADRVFFCNSGTEAIECGFKMIRRYFYNKGEPQRNRIIAMSGAFHGRSLAAIAAAGNPVHCEGFLLADSGFDQAEFGNIKSLEQQIGENTAAVILEPIQGEGGITVVEESYLRAIKDLCDKHGLLLMLDEVQCGVGRTGSLYAHQQLGVNPDVLASAKGLGGGFPIGACLATEELASALSVGTHGSTFGGNPLAMSVGNAVMEIVSNEDFLNNVIDSGNYFKEELEKLINTHSDLLKSVSGTGLMIGLVCEIDSATLIAKLQEQKLLVVKAGGNSLRLLPALNVSREEIDLALSILKKVLASW